MPGRESDSVPSRSISKAFTAPWRRPINALSTNPGAESWPVPTMETRVVARGKGKSDELLEVLGNHCGVGLWDAILVNEDAMHPKSQWTWTNEFRRLLGFRNETEFPNVCQSWSDKLHPDDSA